MQEVEKQIINLSSDPRDTGMLFKGIIGPNGKIPPLRSVMKE